MKTWVYVAVVASAGALGACSWGNVTRGDGGGAGGDDGWGGTGTGAGTGWTTGTGTGAGTGTGTTSMTTDWTTSTGTDPWTTTGACDAMCSKAANECGYGDLCASYGVLCGDPSHECAAACVVNADCWQIATLIQAEQDPSALDGLEPSIRSCVYACWGVTSTNTETGTSTKPTCDGSGDCNACQECATSPGGMCEAAKNACGWNQACIDLIGCFNSCQDQTCAEACYQQYPDGIADFNAYLSCILNDACPADCN